MGESTPMAAGDAAGPSGNSDARKGGDLLDVARCSRMQTRPWSVQRLQRCQTEPFAILQGRQQSFPKKCSVVSVSVRVLAFVTGVLHASEAGSAASQFQPLRVVKLTEAQEAALWAVAKRTEGTPSENEFENVLVECGDVDICFVWAWDGWDCAVLGQPSPVEKGRIPLLADDAAVACKATTEHAGGVSTTPWTTLEKPWAESRMKLLGRYRSRCCAGICERGRA